MTNANEQAAGELAKIGDLAAEEPAFISAAVAALTRAAHFGPARGDAELLMPPIDCDLQLRNLRADQRAALEALAHGLNYEQAAGRAEVDRRTLYRWMHHDRAFVYALEKLRERLAAGACDRLIQGAQAAATALCVGAARGKIRAAEILLRFVLDLRRSVKRLPTPQGKTTRSAARKRETTAPCPRPRRQPARAAVNRPAKNVPSVRREALQSPR